MSHSTAVQTSQVPPTMDGTASGGSFVEALISQGKPCSQTFPSSDSCGPVSGYLAPKRIHDFPIGQVATKRRSFRETASWEGVVVSRSEDGITAKLSRRYHDFPAEEALIPWLEIDDADQPLAVEGALFSWKVGHLDSNGQRLSVSRIEFRRIPNFSARERSSAQQKATEYAALFDD